MAVFYPCHQWQNLSRLFFVGSGNAGWETGSNDFSTKGEVAHSFGTAER